MAKSISGAKVCNILPRSGPNWLLVPGGPGMGSEYLTALFNRLDIDGSIWTFDLQDSGGQSGSDAEIVEGWKNSLLAAAKQLKPALLFGHSFGGMLALSTKGLEKYLLGLILADSDPEDWLKTGNDSPIPKTELATWAKIFEAAPSDRLYKDYFMAIAPYYFGKEHLYEGRDLINRNSYSYRALLAGEKAFFSNYKVMMNLQRLAVFCLAGEHDVITPLKIYRRNENFKNNKNVRYFSIPGAGHFPWVENFQEFSAVLQLIAKSIHPPRRRKIRCP